MVTMETTRRGPNIWVVSHQGQFSVVEEGRRRHLVAPVTQREAVAIGRRIARANGSELFVQGVGGRIRTRDSHGSDPYPPKG